MKIFISVGWAYSMNIYMNSASTYIYKFVNFLVTFLYKNGHFNNDNKNYLPNIWLDIAEIQVKYYIDDLCYLSMSCHGAFCV